MQRDVEKAQRLKARWAVGEGTLGTQLAMTDATAIEIFGRAGYDWAVIDTEHAAQTTVTVKTLLQVASATPMVPLVRILRLDGDEVRRWLDLGASGILCPLVQTSDEARELVGACRYPPTGRRSYGPRRAGGYGFEASEYFRLAASVCICLVMIESGLGVDNADDIMGVEGVDGVIVGPMDLSIDLGCFGEFTSSTYVTAIERVADAARRHSKAMGIAARDMQDAREWREKGYSLVMLGGDETMLMQGAAQAIDSWRAEWSG